MRDRYIQLALDYIPHLVQLVDRNPYSPTYGCFDREYWHYHTSDFPCGMSQEFVLPFALLYKYNFPGNPYRGLERMREIATAGIHFAIKGSHRDGTCDDYYPFERAMGALVFSLYACTEAYILLGLDNLQLVEFFKRRGDHLATHNETGRLSNHQALAALSVYNVYQITGEEKYRRVSEDRVALTLSWQHPEEGWFQEYEGADPGYHTCTIDFLAKLYQKSLNESLIAPMRKAVEFAWYFMHPDGSYGGEYGSRNTYHFYPHGFEVVAPFTEKAGQVADQFLRGVGKGKRYHNDDDRMCCHNVYDWLQAWLDYYPERPKPINERENFLRWFSDAKIAVCKTDRYYGVTNLSKGGVIKVFDEEGPLSSDTGLIGELDDGRILVTHLVDPKNEVHVNMDSRAFRVDGFFSLRRTKLSSPFKMVLFRILLLTIGCLAPNLIRSFVQKLLITDKPRTPYRFSRMIRFRDGEVEIVDKIKDPMQLKRLSVGSDATSIYVANSNVYQESVLFCQWQDASQQTLGNLRRGEPWRRTVSSRSTSFTNVPSAGGP
jgi:hypothetical protein